MNFKWKQIDSMHDADKLPFHDNRFVYVCSAPNVNDSRGKKSIFFRIFRAMLPKCEYHAYVCMDIYHSVPFVSRLVRFYLAQIVF